MRHSILGTTWQELPADPDRYAALARELNLPPIVARVLAARDIANVHDARIFLHGGLDDLHDPLLMRDMPAAVACVRRALDDKLPIRIYGDYDADGITATALLVRALGALGATVDYYLPHRIQDGYGLNTPAVERAATDGIKLVITVDCGITAHEQLQRARDLGLEVIVTDHHEPPRSLPPAAAVLDPKRPDCPYPFKDLSGVGVAYKLVAALGHALGLRPGAERAFLDLVAIGTIADVVGLTGENRLLVKHGLDALGQTGKQGIAALLEAASISPPVTSYNVAFGLAPRLNAVGRLDHAHAAAALLVTCNTAEARELAQRLCAVNTQRQDEERRTLESAEEMIRDAVDLDRERLIMLAREDWHPGVIGVVASRLVERYCRPAVLVATTSSGDAKGSARSIRGFHMHDALCQCSSLLRDFGGHALAAGFSIAPDNLDSLRSRLLAHAAETLRPEDLVRRLDLDAWADLSDLNPDAVNGINALAPFGTGNPHPLIGVRDLTLQAFDTCGAEGQHLRLTLRADDSGGRPSHSTVDAIWFRAGHLAAHLAAGTAVDVCCIPEIDDWGGVRRVRLKLHDLALDNPPPA